MKRTRWSLFYLAGYLVPSGVLLIVAPEIAFKLFMSTGHYDDVFPRVAGMLMLGLGIVTIQVIRLRLEAFYPTTIMIRSIFIVGFSGFYLYTRDPFFLFVLAVVTFGVLLTTTSYLLDRRNR